MSVGMTMRRRNRPEWLMRSWQIYLKAEVVKPPEWTDPQKLDSLVRLARGIEFGIAPDLIPLIFA
jgi:hypothetical protein